MKPEFQRRIFWDIDFDILDIDGKSNFVIARVFERGDVDDIRQCRRYYGDEKITEVLLNVRFLPEHSMHLAAAVINKEVSEFKCYKIRQLNPELYPY